MFWTTPKKIALTIALAVIAWYLFNQDAQPAPSKGRTYVEFSGNETSVPYLVKTFNGYNQSFFNGKLPETTISYNLSGENMAESVCDEDGTNCQMNFNPRYTVAQRVAESTMIHEMCHIKTWTRHLEKNRPAMAGKLAYDHDKAWQACMLSLDAMGIFRELNIDYYKEK